MSDQAPKSAYELAMERLRRRDAEAGVVEQPLTAAQKDAIAEARNVCEAKLAEMLILHRAARARAQDPAALAELDEHHRRDVQRATDDRDRRIARIRAGSA
jgi:hypothetical protein